jgi:uncharacterized RDD family membrane protein YckC
VLRPVPTPDGDDAPAAPGDRPDDRAEGRARTTARASSRAVPASARRFQGRRAGLVTRVAAGVIDAGVVIGLLAVGYLLVAGSRFVVNPQGFSFPSAPRVGWLWAFLGVLAVYLTASWATTGRSYGDHVLGLRVVTRRGRRPGWAWAFLRAVFCTVFPVGLFWVAVSSGNRSVQDLVLRTSVVYDWREGGDAAGP